MIRDEQELSIISFIDVAPLHLGVIERIRRSERQRQSSLVVLAIHLDTELLEALKQDYRQPILGVEGQIGEEWTIL